MYCVCMKTGYLKMNCVNDYIVIVSDVSNHTIHSYYHWTWWRDCQESVKWMDGEMEYWNDSSGTNILTISSSFE